MGVSIGYFLGDWRGQSDPVQWMIPWLGSESAMALLSCGDSTGMSMVLMIPISRL